MTTIVYKDGVIAIDSLVLSIDKEILSNNTNKIIKSLYYNNYVIASGLKQHILIFANEVLNKKELNKFIIYSKKTKYIIPKQKRIKCSGILIHNNLLYEISSYRNFYKIKLLGSRFKNLNNNLIFGEGRFKIGQIEQIKNLDILTAPEIVNEISLISDYTNNNIRALNTKTLTETIYSNFINE